MARDSDDPLAEKFAALFPHLNERQRRLVAAADARMMGRGGVTAVSGASGLARSTIARALVELDDEPLEPGRVRAEGGLAVGPLHEPQAAPDGTIGRPPREPPVTRRDQSHDPAVEVLLTCRLAQTISADGCLVTNSGTADKSSQV